MKHLLKLTVNKKVYEKAVPTNMTLDEFLREELRLTGTKIGCVEIRGEALEIHGVFSLYIFRASQIKESFYCQLKSFLIVSISLTRLLVNQ